MLCGSVQKAYVKYKRSSMHLDSFLDEDRDDQKAFNSQEGTTTVCNAEVFCC